MIDTTEITAPVAEPVSAPKFTPSLSMDEAIDIAALFNALSHPVRLRLISLLAKHAGEICVFEIAEGLDLSQPTISHHLSILLFNKLVEARRSGLYTYYHLNYRMFARVPAMVSKLIGLEG